MKKERFKAVCFILRADENRYKSILKDLKSSAYRGRDEYPTTLTSAFDLLVRESENFEKKSTQPFYRGERGGRSGRGGGRYGVYFAQTGCRRGRRGRGEASNGSFTRSNGNNSCEIVDGSDGESKPEIKYFVCQFYGHYRGEFPYERHTGFVSVHLGHVLTQDEESFDIPKLCLLLDIYSPVSVTNNDALVTNIHDCADNETITVLTNGGSQLYKQLTELILFHITVYF